MKRAKWYRYGLWIALVCIIPVIMMAIGIASDNPSVKEENQPKTVEGKTTSVSKDDAIPFVKNKKADMKAEEGKRDSITVTQTQDPVCYTYNWSRPEWSAEEGADIEWEPSLYEIAQAPGEDTSKTLRITNIGSERLDFTIDAESAGFYSRNGRKNPFDSEMSDVRPLSPAPLTDEKSSFAKGIVIPPSDDAKPIHDGQVNQTSDLNWLLIYPSSGSLQSGESRDLKLVFDAKEASANENYSANIYISSNDPTNPQVSIGAHMAVRNRGVDVASGSDGGGIPGAKTEVSFNVRNTGGLEDIFDLAVTDEEGWIFYCAVPAVYLSAGEISRIAVTVCVPEDAVVGNTTSLTLTATSRYDSTVIDEDKLIVEVCMAEIGDANLDCNINVLDVLAVINHILDIVPLTGVAFVMGDCNGDEKINVLDALGIVNVILGIGTCPPTVVAKSIITPAQISATVNNREEGRGFTLPISIRSEMDITGLQIQLSYDSMNLTPGEPQLTARSVHMNLASNCKAGELIIILYDIEGMSVPAGSGPILTIPFEMSDNRYQISDEGFQIGEVVLAGPECQTIPVQIEPIGKQAPRLPAPVDFVLHQNYPNPFNPTTSIHYTLSGGERRSKGGGREPFHITLKIYNILGQEVRTLVDERQEPGYFRIEWDGRDNSGSQVSSGVYIYRLSMDNGRWSDIKRMVLLK